MSFDIPKIHKWAENIENILTEWAEDEIREFYYIEYMDELTEDQINEIQEFVDNAEDTWYDWVCIGLRNVINWWENGNYDDETYSE